MQVQLTQIVLRVLVTILLLVATVCIGIGREICRKDIFHTGFWFCINYVPIDAWQYELKGQWFVLISSILVILICIGLIFAAIAKTVNRQVVAALCVGAAIIIFVCFCVEAWYADNKGDHGYVQSYVAATVLYGVAMVLLIVDAVFTIKG